MNHRKAQPLERWSFSLAALYLIAALTPAVAIGGCDGVHQPASKAPPKLATYAGAFPSLFDDSIDPAAVGIADIVARPREDSSLRSRTQLAEVVARMRVSTVTVDSSGGQPLYHLQLSWVGAPLVERGFAETYLDLAVRPDSPAFGVVRWLDSRLIGKTFIGFARRFASAEEPQIRFHLSPDSADVLAAVEQAKALSEVSGR